jgi:uncharacterized membrane protein YeaQ/YmgE (transglycosylase-associated protein family)
MHILWIGLIGLIIGAFAKLLMPGRNPGGIIATSLIGIAGSLAAGIVGHAAGWYVEGERAGFAASVLGAIALLALYREYARFRDRHERARERLRD